MSAKRLSVVAAALMVQATAVSGQTYAQAQGEEGGRFKGCPPGTVPVPETDNCVAAPPGKVGSGRPVSGKSYGGVLRSGPSMESRRVTSLAEGLRIMIVRNTGVMMNGYVWFEIRAGATRGFQWGGILCADAAMPGVLSVCKP